MVFWSFLPHCCSHRCYHRDCCKVDNPTQRCNWPELVRQNHRRILSMCCHLWTTTTSKIIKNFSIQLDRSSELNVWGEKLGGKIFVMAKYAQCTQINTTIFAIPIVHILRHPLLSQRVSYPPFQYIFEKFQPNYSIKQIIDEYWFKKIWMTHLL